jgi:hypothetical protein
MINEANFGADLRKSTVRQYRYEVVCDGEGHRVARKCEDRCDRPSV